MKAREVRELTIEEVQQKHDEMLAEYFGLRVKHALGQLENPLVLRAIRRDIARCKTILAEQGIKHVPRPRRRSAATVSTTKKKSTKKAATKSATSSKS